MPSTKPAMKRIMAISANLIPIQSDSLMSLERPSHRRRSSFLISGTPSILRISTTIPNSSGTDPERQKQFPHNQLRYIGLSCSLQFCFLAYSIDLRKPYSNLTMVNFVEKIVQEVNCRSARKGKKTDN